MRAAIKLSSGKLVGLGVIGRSPAAPTDYTIDHIPPKAAAKGFSLDMLNLFGSSKNEIDNDGLFAQGRSQGNAGTCVANAWANALEFLERVETGESQHLSRLFCDYYSRCFIENYFAPTIEGSYNKTGAMICHRGLPVEDVWPYNLDNYGIEPSDTARFFATEKLDTFFNLDPIGTPPDKVIEAIKKWVECKCPVPATILLGESYPDCFKTGCIKLPNFAKESVLGWHAVLIGGYSKKQKAFRIQNSHDGFGENPKMLGWLPENYLRMKRGQEPIAQDAWCAAKGIWLKERRFK